jgi:hypothetical protein
MKTLKVAACIATILLLGTSTIKTAEAVTSCEITTCRYGGRINLCWANIEREAAYKAKFCRQIVIGSGLSAYAMALSISGACIKAGAVIGMHRPFDTSYRAAPVGSRWHKYYFDRIKSSAVVYFTSRGGMKRNGLTNAKYMVAVPAHRTGIPICKAQN